MSERQRKERVKRIRKPEQRIFSDLADTRAIIDKIVVSVDGKLTKTFRDYELVNVNPKSIYHPGGHYAACIFGDWRITRNPVSIHHGRMVKFKNVPPLRFTLHADKIPLTSAQVDLFTLRCTCAPPRLTVSALELTFDLTRTSIKEIRQQLIHRAKTVRVLTDKRGWQTIYVGSPRSAWQVRIYQKTKSVVRLEFAFRRGFLSKHGINRPEDVLLLRRIKIWKLLSLRRFSRSRVAQATRKWQNETVRRLITNWFKDGRSRESLLQMLKNKRMPATSLFSRTDLQMRLEAMQRRLIW